MNTGTITLHPFVIAPRDGREFLLLQRARFNADGRLELAKITRDGTKGWATTANNVTREPTVFAYIPAEFDT